MVNCCVLNCPSNQFKRRGITFHPFPVEDDLRQRWLKNISRPNWEPPGSARVCSLHFKVDSYRKGFKYKVLHMDAMPTLFPPTLYPGAVQSKPTKPRKTPASDNRKASTDNSTQNGDLSFDSLPIGVANAANSESSASRGRKKGSSSARPAITSRPPRKRKQPSSTAGGGVTAVEQRQFGHQLLPPVGLQQVPSHPYSLGGRHLATCHSMVTGVHHDGASLPHPLSSLSSLHGLGGDVIGGSALHQLGALQLGCQASSNIDSGGANNSGNSLQVTLQHHLPGAVSSDGATRQHQPAPPAANYDAVEAHIATIKEENEISILKKKLKNKDALVRRRDKTIVELASQLSSMERKCANAVAQVPVASTTSSHAASNAAAASSSTAFSVLAAAHRSGDHGARFLMEQVEAFAARERHQWSDFALEHCAHWHLKSPEAYAYVKDAGLLLLPSRDTIILCTGVGELAMPETPGAGGGGGVLFVEKLAASVLL